MDYNEFRGSLDPNNPSFESLCEWIRNRHGKIVLARKGSDLVEVLQDFCAQQRWPMVDKRLGVVFGVERGGHELIMNFLYAYHRDEESSFMDLGTDLYRQRAWNYMQDGLGYYISCMEPDKIVARASYRPDRCDKDTFLMFKRAG